MANFERLRWELLAVGSTIGLAVGGVFVRCDTAEMNESLVRVVFTLSCAGLLGVVAAVIVLRFREQAARTRAMATIAILVVLHVLSYWATVEFGFRRAEESLANYIHLFPAEEPYTLPLVPFLVVIHDPGGGLDEPRDVPCVWLPGIFVPLSGE